MRPGLVLHLRGHTTSPFHSTRQEYSNLVKCAPYILGSTIRGALLKRLIERGVCPHLPQLNESHRDAELAEIHRECALRPFFPRADELPKAWFSFGRFARGDSAEMSAEELNLRFEAHTRIGLERRHNSVAEGAIVTIECIKPETPFRFDVVLFDEGRALADDLVEGAKLTGTSEGWGRFRSIGLGQFAIGRVEREEFEEWVERATNDWYGIGETAPEAALEFTTPYVLSRGETKLPAFDSETSARRLREQIGQVLRAVGEDEGAMNFTHASFTIRPEFVSPYSYERGTRQHSLASLEGSWIAVRFDGETHHVARALAVAGGLGIGEWNQRGFGRFRRRTVTHKPRRAGR